MRAAALEVGVENELPLERITIADLVVLEVEISHLMV
jgi:hypothetical protein